MLILVIGDLHIPFRGHVIPSVFRENLSGGKINKILCTGNLCTKEELESLKAFCPDIQYVRGEFDDDDLPETEQVVENIGNFKIGLVSRQTLIPSNDKARLAAKARELDVDILAFGGGHRAGVFEHNGTLFVNPGSATGAATAETPNPKPSFILIKIQGGGAQIFTYTLSEDGTTDVRKSKFSKEGEE